MKAINISVPHGIGPIAKLTDLAVALNRELVSRGRDKLSIIVPLIYERQREILMQDHGELIKEDKFAILLDSFQGGILNSFIYGVWDSESYEDYLKRFVKDQGKIEEYLRSYISGSLLPPVQTLDGEKVNLRGEDIELEISHNPLVSLGFKNSYYTTIAYPSEILRRTAESSLEGRLNFDTHLLKEAEKIALRLEDDRKIHFLTEPNTFSFDAKRKPGKEIWTPPLAHWSKPSREDIEEGMYVSVTGISGLEHLFDSIGSFGMKLYCPPKTRLEGPFKNADNQHAPSIVSNPRIKALFARPGLSPIWQAIMNLKPLIIPGYSDKDDPEMFFNQKMVAQLGLGIVYDGTQDPKILLEKARSLKPNLERIRTLLAERYRISGRPYGRPDELEGLEPVLFDGINYTAKIIADDLEGKDISWAREIRPVLQGYEA